MDEERLKVIENFARGESCSLLCQEELHELIAEIRRLRAEVERLRAYLKGRDEKPVARWIRNVDKNEPWFKCSECGYIPIDFGSHINFCGKCGAKLESK